ncbi:MAG: TonB-dependent receptor [Betaproteobacteria bacterium]|nr:TonB-dependent receptor [Betaproteobacteria bacterium]
MMKFRVARGWVSVLVRSTVLTAALAVPCLSDAQNALQSVVVSASRSSQLLSEALPHTTVIGREHIERSQALDLPALLAGEAGFQFSQSGGRGATASLFLRGSAAMQVLVLLDGVPLTKQDSTGTVSLEHIMLDQVERVEVVRGNVSAIYGSGAIGGVIQVFSRPGQDKALAFAQLEAGSYGSAHAATGISGAFGDTRYSFGIARQTTRGLSAMNSDQYPHENRDADGYRNSNFNVALSRQLASGQTLGLRVQGSDGRFESDGGGFGGPTDIYLGASKLATWTVYSHNQISPDWRSELSLGQSRERSVYDARLSAYPYDSSAISRSQTLNWTHRLQAGPWLLSAGVERQLQSIASSDSYATELDRSRAVGALFAGMSGSQGPHAMQLNLRRDDAQGLAASTTAYAGYGFTLAAPWKLIASMSTAFNLPPLGYLYDAFSGNPALLPESARSAELGLQFAQGRQLLRATLFRTRISNLLLYDPDTYRFSNLSSARNQGLELSASGSVAAADWRASLTLQDPTDAGTGLRLVRRAATMAAVGASVPMGPWRLGADLRFSGERPDRADNPVMPAYAVANLSARYALSAEVSLTARVDNLFDRHYQTAYGYNQPGRGAFVGMLWAQK